MDAVCVEGIGNFGHALFSIRCNFTERLNSFFFVIRILHVLYQTELITNHPKGVFECTKMMVAATKHSRAPIQFVTRRFIYTI